MLCRKRYLQNKWRKMVKEVQISPAIVHFFAIFFSKKGLPWVCAGRFACHNPCKINKLGDDIFMDFTFFTQNFFKESLWIFFRKCQMPLEYVELCERSKKKKTYFGGIYSFLRRLLRLEWEPQQKILFCIDLWDCDIKWGCRDMHPFFKRIISDF